MIRDLADDEGNKTIPDTGNHMCRYKAWEIMVHSRDRKFCLGEKSLE